MKPPLLLLHGWPGPFLEFERLLEPMGADGHDVVVPSLPGFAFSNPITGVIGPRRGALLGGGEGVLAGLGPDLVVAGGSRTWPGRRDCRLVAEVAPGPW